VRVRAHVDALSGQEFRRPHLVEEDERPCRFGAGSARHTSKLPRSRARGTINVSIVSTASPLGQVGSRHGFQLMRHPT